MKAKSATSLINDGIHSIDRTLSLCQAA